MIANKDSLGNELTKEQIEYFKNTKIVDKDNNLLVVYHGSPTPYFKEFNPKDSKSQFGKYKFGDHNVNYFTTDRKSASTYTEFGYDDGTIFEVYVNIENPYIVDNKSEAEIKSHLNIKDDRLRKQQLELFDRIFNKWKDKILDYSDYRFDELNNDLHKLNLELRPSDCYDEGTDPMDIDYFDLWNLGRNSFIGAEHIIEYQYSTDELFNDDMYDELKSKIVGEDPNDYFFSTDDIVRFVLSLDEGYDGIIIKDIHDSKDMFSDITTDIITLGSPNQIKSISNKNPSSSNRIDENRDDFYDDNLLWKGPEYSETPKNDRIRLYHQTDKKSIPSIIKNGLQTKFKRWYDNPGENVLWATDEDPTIDWSWNYGDALVVLDLPKDFDMRKVNNHEYNIYQDIDPKYINAIYLKSSYVKPIMRDFQNTLDIDKSIGRFKQGLLTEHLPIDYKLIFQSTNDKKLNESEILNDVDYDLELYDDVETNEYDDYLNNPNDFDLEKEQRNQIDRVRARNKGKTYYIPTDIKDLLTKENYRYGWLDTFDFKVIDLEKIIKENGLDNPKHGMFYRRMDRWGDNPDLYYYDTNKEDWLYSPIRLNASGRIIDGNHRLWALYNNGYKYAEVLAPKESLSESLLLEVSRRQIIDKSKRGRAYAPSNQALGKNRWERKKWSRVANSTREFNSIDMNTFFKKDILIVNVPVQGETDRYIVKIKFSGVLEEIQKNVQANNNKLDYRIISQALSRVFNSGDVFINCNCMDFKTRFAHWSTVQGYNSGKPENRPNRFDWTNSHDDMGGACKHGNLVLSNLSWMMKVASVINNYIHYAEQFMQRQFADIIFPKIYGVKYPDAVQMGLFDRQYLKHSKGVIDAINQFGSTRTRFKKAPKPEQTEPEFEVHPKQLSIFDIDNEEEEIPEDKLGNKGFKKQSIFDYGVDEVEEPEEVEKPKGFKPRRDTPVIKPKGFKKLSIFDDEESEN